MAFKQLRVNIADIDFSDITFRITRDNNFETLIPSIKEMGVLHPPLLRKKESDFGIVCGFKRLLACEQLGMKTLDVLVAEKNHPPLDLAMRAIMDNALHRSLDLMACARSYKLLNSYLSGDDQALIVYAKRMGFPNSIKKIRQIIGFCNFPGLLQESIADGTIGQSVALMLSDMDDGLKLAFGKLFSQLPLNMNKQREIITLIMECAKRDGISPLDMFQESILETILQDPEMKAPQKARKIRSHLKKRRYPHLSQREDDFAALIKKMAMPASMTLTPPPFFEGEIFNLSLQFKNEKELKSQLESIQMLINDPLFSSLFDS